MAEGWTKTIPCRYFSNGLCREGQNCRYAHIRRSPDEGSPRNSPRTSSSNATNNRRYSGSCAGTSQQSTTSGCLFFKRGKCVYGSSCRFAHENDRTSSNESITQNWRNNTESEDESNLENLTSDSLSEASASDFVLPKELSKRHNTEVESNGFSLKYSGSTKTNNRLIEKNESSEHGEDWVNAPEFIPLSLDNCDIPTSTDEGSKTYAEALNAKSESSNNSTTDSLLPNPQIQLCPYLQTGECKYGEGCQYLHGDICELCSCACLNPFDETQRKQHVNECIKQHEKDMELSFAVARSRDKQCGICFEVVLDKPREQRFGILPNCNHCFCLECIRKWRQSTQFENKIIRACPECRVTSNFVCPSMYWVDGKEEKDQLINDYRLALSLKDCKYFKSGVGKCPFGNKCFYLHAYPDGTKTDVGPPPRQRRAQGGDGEMDFLQRFILWDFFGERENRWLYNFEDIEDIVAFFSDSDDSDTSDYDFW